PRSPTASSPRAASGSSTSSRQRNSTSSLTSALGRLLGRRLLGGRLLGGRLLRRRLFGSTGRGVGLDRGLRGRDGLRLRGTFGLGRFGRGRNPLLRRGRCLGA